MFNFTTDFDTAETRAYARSLEEWRTLTGSEWGPLLKGEVRTVAISFATETQPFGLGDDARKAGEGAVESDIRKVFATPAEVFEQMKRRDGEPMSREWYGLMEGRKYKAAERVLRTSKTPWRNTKVGGTLDRGVHQSSRGRGGRVRRHRPDRVVNPERRNAYIKREIRKVGYVKGPFARIVQAMGGKRGLPRWVTRHKSSPFRVNDFSAEKTTPYIEFANLVGYAGSVLSQASRRKALNVARRRLMKRTEYALAGNAKKAGLK
jgi:hypothetical protein